MGSCRKGLERAQLIKHLIFEKWIEEAKLEATKIIPVEDDKAGQGQKQWDGKTWREPSVL